MIELGDYVIPTCLVFCRIGGALLLIPGMSSARVPIQVRLFIALSLSLALAPLLLDESHKAFSELGAAQLARLILTETGIGILLGLTVRVFISALQFMGSAIAMYIGMGTLPGAPISDDEPQAALGAFIAAVASVLFFVLDLHLLVIRGLVEAYHVVPLGSEFDARSGLDQVTKALSRSFFLVLQISGPFLAYGVIINLLFGLVNKMVPQIPAYFISIPFLIAGGLFLSYFLLSELMSIYFAVFREFIVKG